MKAIGFSTAENYSFDHLLPALKDRYHILPFLADGVMHISLSKDVNDESAPEAFIFNDGTFVTWGASAEEDVQLLDVVTKAQVNPYATMETERFDYYQDPTQYVF